MKTLKRIMVALLALLPLATGVVVADEEHGYSRMFVFGASFIDPGNHFAVTGETAHPPFELIEFASYGIGGHHTSNGRTWVEVVAQEMELTDWAKPAYRDPAFGNYAFAYGRARGTDYTIPKNLTSQVTDWINNGYCTYAAMDDTLFIVDAAYADFFDIMAAPDEAAIMQIMGEMTASIGSNIGRLYECGARNLLFAYAVPVEAAPIVSVMPNSADAPPISLSKIYNFWFLKPFVIDVLPEDMNVSTVNFFSFVNEILMTPEDFGLTNVTSACVTPFVLKDAFCKNRDEYFWWDHLHPTKKVHALFAELALEQLP